jgi:hypothetical protein
MSSIGYRERTFMPENAGQNQGRWEKSRSGNPHGKPKGTRHHATRIVEQLLDRDRNQYVAAEIERRDDKQRNQDGRKR